MVRRALGIGIGCIYAGLAWGIEGTPFVEAYRLAPEEACLTDGGQPSVDAEGVVSCLHDDTSGANLWTEVVTEEDTEPVLTAKVTWREITLTPKDPSIYTLIDGWWYPDLYVVVFLPPAEEDAGDTGADEDTCTGALVIEVGGKTTLGGALTTGVKSDACTVDIVLADGTYTGDYTIDRPVRLRAAKGASPELKGTLFLDTGAFLMIDDVAVGKVY